MKIILDPTNKGFGGDLFSIERLLSFLECYSKLHFTEPQVKATINQWISYLTNLSNQIIRSNLDSKEPPLEFTFPFESEYLNFLSEAKDG